jgi:hypothetical protein
MADHDIGIAFPVLYGSVTVLWIYLKSVQQQKKILLQFFNFPCGPFFMRNELNEFCFPFSSSKGKNV